MGAFLLSMIVALATSFVCSVSEAALLSVTHAQAQALADTRPGQLLRKFKAEIDIPIAAILILNTIANTVGATVAGAACVMLFGPESLVPFSIGFTLTLLLLGEIVPKTLGASHSARLIVPVVYWVQIAAIVLAPVIWLARLVTKLMRGERAPVTSLKEIRLLAELGKMEGALAERTAKMIDGAARMKELCAYDVMVPRTASAFLHGTRTLGEVLQQATASGYSRFPYSRSGDADKIDGVVLTRELLLSLHEAGIGPGDARLEEPAEAYLDAILRKTDYVPEAASLEDLLMRFQETRLHLAIVVDEYGGTEGIVTLEDVLEEVVGEIQDESDSSAAFITRRADGTFVCRGRAETRKVFNLIRENDEAESVSLAGYLAERLGRVPVVGDTVELGAHVFLVQRATARRAERILIRSLSPDEKQET